MIRRQVQHQHLTQIHVLAIMAMLTSENVEGSKMGLDFLQYQTILNGYRLE